MEGSHIPKTNLAPWIVIRGKAKEILIIEMISTDGLRVKERQLKSNTLEKTVQKDKKVECGKMKWKVLEDSSPNCNIYLREENRKKEEKEAV